MTHREWLAEVALAAKQRANILAPMASALAQEVPESRLSVDLARAVAAELRGVPTLAELVAVINRLGPVASTTSKDDWEVEAWISGTRRRLAERPDLLALRLSLARAHAPRRAYEAICAEHAPHVLRAERENEAEIARHKQRMAAEMAGKLARKLDLSPPHRSSAPPATAPMAPKAKPLGGLSPEHLRALRERASIPTMGDE
jgi:hypothetical protein